MFELATADDVKLIFSAVDRIHPIDPHKRLRLAENLANEIGITFSRRRAVNHNFNKFTG